MRRSLLPLALALPGDSVDSVLAHIGAVIGDPRVTVAARNGSAWEASKLSSSRSSFYRALERVTNEFFPGVIILPGIVYGATDSRHFAPIATDIYRFVPRLTLQDELSGIHGTDERVGVEALATSVRAYERLIRVGAGSAASPDDLLEIH